MNLINVTILRKTPVFFLVRPAAISKSVPLFPSGPMAGMADVQSVSIVASIGEVHPGLSPPIPLPQ